MKLPDTLLRLLFYALWLSVSLWQGWVTEIFDDEAYYWKYAQLLAWGYYDHPPMVALLIKAGFTLFKNELGVRLFTIALGTATIYALERLVKPANLKLFYALILSIAVLHFIGFLALPDAPLLFLSVVFLLAYRSFCEEQNLWNAVLLSFVVCGMLLSKYHAVLPIAFTVLSNLRLLRSTYFWIIVLLAAVVLTPHLYWQYTNNFPSLQYHLAGRSTDAYTIVYTLQYLASLPFLFGPFAGMVFLVAAVKVSPNNTFEKALKWNWWGVYVFFLLMSFKGRVETHWTMIALAPSVYFGYRYLEANDKLRKWFYRSVPVAVLLILFLRVVVVFDILPKHPLADSVRNDYLGWKTWALTIKQKAESRPVLFMNSYKRAARYEFYAGSLGVSYNNIMGRQNQYDIWNYEDTLRGKEVMLIPNYPVGGFESFETEKGSLQYTYISNFQSHACIKLSADDVPASCQPSDSFRISLKAALPKNTYVDLEENSNYLPYVSYQFFRGRTLVLEEVTSILLTNELLEKGKDIQLQLHTPSEPGKYGLYFSVKTGWLPPTYNSKRYAVEVKK
ncbi:MAG: glycosyltransferase family 39 protein [Chitinophagales bacterium]|nr:glycosyltransferase family 39 protein [Chitinophagales bacterium]